MLNVSQGFKDALQENVIYSDSYIVVYDVDESTNVTIDSEEIQEIEITSSSFINEKVIGNVVSYLMTIKILGDATSSINLTSEKHIEPYIGVLVNGAYEYVKYQKFIADEVKYDDTTNITTIKCVDFLYKSNLEFTDTNTYPITLFQLAQSVATFLELDLENTSIVNGSFSIADKRFPSFESCRTILSKIAELSGCFVRINKVSGKIEFVNAFPDMGSTHLDLSVFTHAQLSSFTHQGLEGSEPSSYHDQDNYFKLTLKDNKFGTKGINTLVIGYSVIEGENNTKVNQPNVDVDGNIEVQILDNEIVNTEAKRLLVIDELFDIIDEFKYQPFEMEYIGYPHIEIGDVVEFEKKDGTNVRSVVTDYSIRFNGGLFGNIKGRALSKVQTSYHNTSRNAKRLRNAEIMVDKANAQINLLADGVDGLETSVTDLQVDLNGVNISVGTYIKSQENIMPYAQSFFEQGNIDITLGLPVSSVNHIRMIEYGKCSPNTSYTFSKSNGITANIYWYDSSENFIDYYEITEKGLWISPAFAEFFKISIGATGITIDDMNMFTVIVKPTEVYVRGANYSFTDTEAIFDDANFMLRRGGVPKLYVDTITGEFKVGRFAITDDDLVYESGLFDYPYDFSDVVKLRRILAGLETATAYDLWVYDTNNTGTLTTTDLTQVRGIVDGTGSTTPKQVRTLTRVGTTNGGLTNQFIGGDGSLGPISIMRGDKIVTSAIKLPQDTIIGGIVESGSNANGSYTKFSDGTMKCVKTVTVNTNVNTTWGATFISSLIGLGNFPESFVSPPNVVATVVSQAGASIIRIIDTTSSFVGNATVMRGVSVTGENITFSIIADGRWKS